MKLTDLIILTPDYILSKTTQEEIFEHYLQEEVIPYVKMYKNPLRNDESAGCKFFYSDVKGVLYLHDFSYNLKYNCFDFVQSLTGENFKKTLSIIYNDVIKGHGEKRISLKYDYEKIIQERNKNRKPFQIKKRDYSVKELEFWNIGNLDIDQSILEEYEIYCTKTYWEDGAVVENCTYTFAYYDNSVPLQLYFPKHKGTNKRRFSCSTLKYYGGGRWIDYSQDYIIIIPKRKCSFYASQFGINNMYILLERYLLSKEIIQHLKSNFKYVFYLFDNDRHGKSAAWLYRKIYGIIPIHTPEENDLTEFISLIGKGSFIDYIHESSSRLGEWSPNNT